jgi:hypothetical protein
VETIFEYMVDAGMAEISSENKSMSKTTPTTAKKIPTARSNARSASITSEQFEVIADLIRSRGPARTAAHLVLVGGSSNVDAAAKASVSRQSVSNTTARFRSADIKIRHAYNVKKTLIVLDVHV